MRKAITTAALAAATLALSAATASPAHADGFIIIERPPRPTRPVPVRRQYFPLSVKYHDVSVTIKDGVAVTKIDQTFHNPNPQQLEGTYIFPLPEGAAVDQFSMYMDGKEVQGEMLDRDRARNIYEGIVRRMQDPALLEYMGRGAFKCRVFPIPANGDKRIKLSYSQVLKKSGLLRRYVYPLNTEKFSSTPLDRCTVKVSIEHAGAPIGAVYSPTHEIEVVRPTGGKVEAVYERNRVKPDKDFALYYATAEKEVEFSLLSYTDHDGGYFVGLLSPNGDPQTKPLPKDVAFVFDTSGSMAGEKMEQAKKALLQAVEGLYAEDRFTIIDFSTDVRTFSRELVTADAEGKKRARLYVDSLMARGGTAIHDALDAAHKVGKKSDRPFFVVFMTDGQPTIGVTEPAQILKLVGEGRGANERIFALGIGADVNTHLLDKLAADNRGDRDYVLPEEDIELTVAGFVEKISYPVLTDAEIEFEGAWVRDIYPKRVGDLFRGNQVVITGRYRKDGPVAVRLRGMQGTEKVEQVFEATFEADKTHAFAARLWARRKIAYLLDQMRLHGESAEVRDEIVFLAKKFGVMTPYTSYLVVEDDAEILAGAPGAPRPRRQGEQGGRRPAEDGADEGRSNAFRRFARSRGFSDAPGTGGGAAPEPSPSPEAEPMAPPSAADREMGEALREKKTSGEGALRLAKELAKAQRKDKGSLEDADTSEQERQAIKRVVRKVGGRTFYADRGVWVDSGVKEKDRAKATKVKYLSDDYFKLVKDHPELGECLALGAKVVVAVGDQVFEIVE